MKNLTFECGSRDFRVWDKSQSDFGQCFFHLIIQLPAYGLLAIISSYYIGKRRLILSQSRDWNQCQTFIIYFRSLVVSLLTLLSLVQMLVHFALKSHLISVTEVGISLSKTMAWFLHLIFVLRLKRGSSFNTRGPKLILCSWFVSAVISTFSFRTRYNFFVNNSQEQSIITYEDNHDFLLVDNSPADDYLWLWSSTIEIILQGLYLLTLIPGSSHLEQHQYRQRSRINDVIYNAYEGHENHSYTGFDEDDEEELPLGTAKENCSWISALFFLWVTPMMKKGACGFLRSAENLFDLPLTLSSRHVAINFQRWTVTRGMTLLRSLHVSFGWEFYSVGILKLVSDGMGFCGPILLNKLVSFIENDGNSQEIWVGYSYVGGLFAAAIIGALANTHFNMRMAEINLKIRAALVTTIYRKTVYMRKTTLDKFSSGEIINFMSTDSDRIVNFCPSFHAFWSLPFQVAVTLYLLYAQIQIAFLAGLIFAIILIPINRLIASKIGQYSTEMMKYKDQRVKMMSEILYGIRTLKFHSWETYFYDRVNEIRKKEMKCLKGRKYLDAMCVYFWATTPVLVSVLSFGTYVLLGNPLTAAKVFTSIALFNMLISPLNALPWVLNGVVEAWVSIKRIDKFLQEEETEPHSVFNALPSMMQENTAILAEGCSFDWGNTDGLHINDFNLTVSKGQFIGIIGGVGSGKSSLLLSLLGELNKSSGTVDVPNPNDGVGLVLQEAWIQRGTIRSNICFAPNTNLTRYKSVIDSCCLKEDLNSFKYRDDTIVGENGISLSGGQKIRLTLARAVYQDFDIYFLDDIFAAVDYKVAKHLYRKCIMGILKNKTKILCTHHTQFLKDADWILVVNEGNIIDEGTPNEILPRYGESSLENSVSDSESDLDDSNKNSKAKRRLQLTATSSFSDIIEPEAQATPGAASMVRSGHSFEFEFTQGHLMEDDEGCDINEESQKQGTIQFHVFRSYYKAIGPFLFWMIMISMTAMQASRNFSDIWLAYWVSQQHDANGSVYPVSTTTTPFPTFVPPTENPNKNSSKSFYEYETGADVKLPIDDDESHWFLNSIVELLPFSEDLDPTVKYYLGIFMLIGLCNSVFTLARAFLFAIGGLTGALKIHAGLLSSILKARMSFFDTTPIGRILNRFSSDVATVDDSLPFVSNILLAQAFGLIGTLALTCYALPWILVVIIPLVLVCNNIQEYYRHTARQLRRLGSVSLSPLYAHFSETLKGLVVIRAMRAVSRFEEMNESHLESSQKCQYSTQAVSQWLSFRLQMVGVVIVSSVGLLGIFQHHYGTADPGIIGLAISYALTVTNALNGFVTVLTETEKEMVAVERLSEYTEDVDTETQVVEFTLNGGSVPYLWPAQGVISFTNVSLKYRENLPYILRNITFETRPAEKIGICGRTGSGKSSLFAALFRIVDNFEGEILIDHVNTKSIHLTELRNKMCIIPQDPLLFSGSLRENLDPKGERHDDELIRALKKCQLEFLVQKLGGLDAFVGDNGNLLSTGQKQLLCLARAVLINAKILCIDEATANVDLVTDQIIQATLRTSFSHSTVIVIAHRVNTILHCDRVLVLSNGEIVEFDDPSVLMEQHSSHFYQLARGNL